MLCLLPEGGKIVPFQSLRECKHLQGRNRSTKLCIDVGCDAPCDLQNAIVCCPTVGLIIVINKRDREDGKRKDHASDQQTQAYRYRLFGKQSRRRYCPNSVHCCCVARSRHREMKEAAEVVARTQRAVRQHVRQLEEAATQRLLVRFRSSCVKFFEAKRHLGDLLYFQDDASSFRFWVRVVRRRGNGGPLRSRPRHRSHRPTVRRSCRPRHCR